MKIGFIGVGVMGSAMARHLAKGGHTVTLHDIDSKQLNKSAKSIPGARKAKSPVEAAAGQDVVVTMLPNGEVVRDVALAKSGIIESIARDAILLDTSSAEPWLTRETGAALAQRGARMVDAPVSGAQEGAETATLVFMAGGAKDDVARVRPLLDLMGKATFHVGALGAGHTMKTVNNLATAIIWLATAEAMAIGKAHGLEPRAMVDVINVSTGTNFITQKKMIPEVLSGRFADPFKLSLMLKDIGIATALAEDKQVPIPVSALTEQLWSAANRAMGETASITEIVRWYEQTAGVELRDK